MKLTMRRVTVATAGVVAVGGLVLGGTEAFASAPAFPGSNAVHPAATSSAAPKANCKAATPSTPNPSATSAKKPRQTRRQAGCGRRPFGGRGGGAGMFDRGVHGQATVKGSDGTFSVQEWQTGKVASVSGDTLTVTDASGTTWTWTVQSDTRYRVSAGKKGAKGSLADVHTGDTVFVTGVQKGTANDVTALAEYDPKQAPQQQS